MTAELISCSCCGTLIRDNAEQNTDFGQVPYPHDTGFGMCPDCGGVKPKKAPPKNESEAAARKRLGWAMCCFADARIGPVAAALSEENRAKFLAFPYAKQVRVICGLVEKGCLT